MSGVVLGWTNEVLSLPLTAYRIVYLVFNHISGTNLCQASFQTSVRSITQLETLAMQD